MRNMLMIAAGLMIGVGTYGWAGGMGQSAGGGSCGSHSGGGGCAMAMAGGGAAAEGKAAYPLDVCVVSGEKLGEHGDAYVFEHDGQEVRLCCKPCLKDFKKDPGKYLKKIQDARKS